MLDQVRTRQIDTLQIIKDALVREEKRTMKLEIQKNINGKR
jgi:hypothetical protein